MPAVAHDFAEGFRPLPELSIEADVVDDQKAPGLLESLVFRRQVLLDPYEVLELFLGKVGDDVPRGEDLIKDVRAVVGRAEHDAFGGFDVATQVNHSCALASVAFAQNKDRAPV